MLSPVRTIILTAMLGPALFYPIMSFVGYCHSRCIPEARSIIFGLGFFFVVVLFVLSLLIVWKKSTVLQDKSRRITRGTTIVGFSVLYIYLTSILHFVAFFEFTPNFFTKVVYGKPAEIYYVNKFHPFLEGDDNYAYTLYKKQNFLFMEEIGQSSRVYSEEIKMIQFSEPGDYMYETAVFLYSPEKNKLYLPLKRTTTTTE